MGGDEEEEGEVDGGEGVGQEGEGGAEDEASKHDWGRFIVLGSWRALPIVPMRNSGCKTPLLFRGQGLKIEKVRLSAGLNEMTGQEGGLN